MRVFPHLKRRINRWYANIESIDSELSLNPSNFLLENLILVPLLTDVNLGFPKIFILLRL